MDFARAMPLKSFLSGLLLASALVSPAHAQEIVQALPGTTDADALAADMRRLAANPRDVDALVDAAQLSLRLDDMRASAALLARAGAVDPRNPRVKAGQGSILVRSERPGEALRYFAQAESMGLDTRAFAADRALAYDLIGEQERAQRDYRTALRDRPADDETIRRYALSLGISGQRQRALALLDPLVRRSDRGAWRAQAFVLAMTGDVGGASRIAATMMPGGAQGLAAFFARLPTLPATDRAFAVHFGEVRATPERVADARMAPPLSPLPREAGSPTVVASNTVAAPTRRRDRDGSRTQVAAARVPPVVSPRMSRETAAVVVRPQPQPATAIASVQPTRTASTVPTAVAAAAPASSVVRPAAPAQYRPPIATVATTTLPPQPSSAAAARVETTTTVTAPPRSDVPPSTVALAAQPSPALASASTPPPASTTVIQPSTTPPTQLAAAPPPARTAAGGRMSEDSILARIVAGLSIPASELGVEGPDRPAPVAQAAPPVARPAPVIPAPVRPDPVIAAKAEADRVATEKLATAKAAADRRAADRKAVADKKALAEKKAAAAEKALADKEAAEAKRQARANPERIWVQVAGGAFEGDLPKAFARVKAKAPAVFGSRDAWTTPLRATNRVLAGPFKTDAEARVFVNDLSKQGVSAFTFTSEEGQPVKRLGAKGATAAEDEPEIAPKASKTAAKPGRKELRRR